MITLSVRDLFEHEQTHLQLSCLAGEAGFRRKITIPQIQRPGLAVTGDITLLNPGRIQIFGRAELRYLKKLNTAKRTEVLRRILGCKVPCLILTYNQAAPEPLLELAKTYRIPLFRTTLSTANTIVRVQQFLESTLSETTSLHGVLVDVSGVGIILTGKSGIGKSECALELIMRGHRLVADDMVKVRKQRPTTTLYGHSSDITKFHMEIRGLGIISITDLFGVAAVRDQKIIEMVIELVEWDPHQEYERLGVMEKTYTILNVPVPFLQIPVRPGRTLSTIIEVAARNQLLKQKGIHAAQRFEQHLTQQIMSGKLKQELKPLLTA